MRLEAIALVPSLSSLALYLVLSIGAWIGARIGRSGPPVRPPTPRVSILKPLAGNDEELRENLASFAALDYPDYEVLLGVASREDPAHAVARELLLAHPQLDARLVVTNPSAAQNPKVAQLIALQRLASGSILVVSDSNVRADPGYLAPLVREVSRPGVAATSSVIVGEGEETAGAAMENLQLGGHIAPTVLSLYRWAGRPVTVGKSLAVRRRCLEQIGGFRAVGDYLGEDYMLGHLLANAGFYVTVSTTPVRNRNVRCSLERTFERHVRWAKLRRSIAPVAFALEPLLNPIALATATLVLFPTLLALLALCAITVTQAVVAHISVRVLRGSPLRIAYWPLEILRAYLALGCWLIAWTTRRVTWRGHLFELREGSRVVPVESTPAFLGPARA